MAQCGGRDVFGMYRYQDEIRNIVRKGHFGKRPLAGQNMVRFINDQPMRSANWRRHMDFQNSGLPRQCVRGNPNSLHSESTVSAALLNDFDRMSPNKADTASASRASALLVSAVSGLAG
jgi:hypothetical protein